MKSILFGKTCADKHTSGATVFGATRDRDILKAVRDGYDAKIMTKTGSNAYAVDASSYQKRSEMTAYQQLQTRLT